MKIIFAANINITTDLVSPEKRHEIISKSYIPTLEAHCSRNIPITVFASGWSLEFIKNVENGSLNKMLEMIELENLCVESHSYGHGVFPLQHSQDNRWQVEIDCQVHNSLFGRGPKGFLPPEWLFDYTIPQLLRENYIEWMLLGGANFVGYYGQSEKDLRKVNWLEAPDGTSIPVFLNYGDKSLRFRDALFDVFGGGGLSRFWKYFKNVVDGYDCDELLVFYFDLETAYFNYRAGNDPVDNYGMLLDSFLADDSFRFTTFNDYLKEYGVGGRQLFPFLQGNYKPISFWKEGSERLGSLVDEVRPLLVSALERDPCRAKEALKLYLAGQTSDARSAVTEARAYGVGLPNQTDLAYGKHAVLLEAMNNLYEAKEISLSVLS